MVFHYKINYNNNSSGRSGKSNVHSYFCCQNLNVYDKKYNLIKYGPLHL